MKVIVKQKRLSQLKNNELVINLRVSGLLILFEKAGKMSPNANKATEMI
jgi:hypothetical protein